MKLMHRSSSESTSPLSRQGPSALLRVHVPSLIVWAILCGIGVWGFGFDWKLPAFFAPRQPAVEEHLDALNRELLDRLQRGGEVFVSNAVVGGRYVLRACIVNFHTTLGDVEAVPAIIVRVGRAVDEQLRSGPVMRRR